MPCAIPTLDRLPPFASRAGAALRSYFAAVIEERRAQPADDLVTKIATRSSKENRSEMRRSGWSSFSSSPRSRPRRASSRRASGCSRSIRTSASGWPRTSPLPRRRSRRCCATRRPCRTSRERCSPTRSWSVSPSPRGPRCCSSPARPTATSAASATPTCSTSRASRSATSRSARASITASVHRLHGWRDRSCWRPCSRRCRSTGSSARRPGCRTTSSAAISACQRRRPGTAARHLHVTALPAPTARAL